MLLEHALDDLVAPAIVAVRAIAAADEIQLLRILRLALRALAVAAGIDDAEGIRLRLRVLVEISADRLGRLLRQPRGREAGLPAVRVAVGRDVALAAADRKEFRMRPGVFLRRDEALEIVVKLHAAVHPVSPSPGCLRPGKPAEEPREKHRLLANLFARDSDRLPLRHVRPVGARHQPANTDVALQELADAELRAVRRRAGDDDGLLIHAADHETVLVQILQPQPEAFHVRVRADVNRDRLRAGAGIVFRQDRKFCSRGFFDILGKQLGGGSRLRIACGRDDRHGSHRAAVDDQNRFGRRARATGQGGKSHKAENG